MNIPLHRKEVTGNPISRLVYITTYFESKNEERKKEVLDCIYANIDSGFFRKCIILTEEKKLEAFDAYNSSFVQVIYVPERPSYEVAFHCCEKDAINVIANSDILFDKTINRVERISDTDFYALSRYENIRGVYKVLYPFRGWTQDVWVIRGKGQLNWDDEPFYFGQGGCDHRMAYIAKHSGYRVINPAFSICTLHRHQSLVRTSSSEIGQMKSRDYHFPEPSFLALSLPGTRNLFYWSGILTRKSLLKTLRLLSRIGEYIRIRFLDRMF